MHFTPTWASWQAIWLYTRTNNDKSKPFVWSMPADDIVAGIDRIWLLTSNPPK